MISLSIEPGSYVMAVSGGVDSMVLMDLVSRIPHVRVTVAHYDHGIRTDAAEDRELVAAAAERYSLPFVYEEGRLGREASEATARHARYAFLEGIRTESEAQAIMTAHHQDDVLETAIINMIRGTGRRGLTALQNSSGRLRPLLDVPKTDILHYAEAHSIRWRDDTTNQDDRYLRNYVRLRLLPRFDAATRRQLLDCIVSLRPVNAQLDHELGRYLQTQDAVPELDRRTFLTLPHAVAKEVLAAWLRTRSVGPFDACLLERVVIAAKTLRPGMRIDLVGGAYIRVEGRMLALVSRER